MAKRCGVTAADAPYLVKERSDKACGEVGATAVRPAEIRGHVVHCLDARGGVVPEQLLGFQIERM